MTDWAIGIDLGGTNIRAAQIDAVGRLGPTISEPVDRHPTEAVPFGQVVRLVRRLIAEEPTDPPIGIGLGVTGPVDPVTTVVNNPFTLPAGMQGSVRDALAGFGVPVRVENDANAAALGEARFGAGQGHPIVLCVTVGTGIGVGLVSHGKPYSGTAGAHPEAGHLVIDPNGPLCYCGERGCLESLSSAGGVLRQAQQAGWAGPGWSALDVYAAASAGQPNAVALLNAAAHKLADGIRALVTVYAPDVVVLVGNALGDPDTVLPIVARRIVRAPLQPHGTQVLAGRLGGMAGCYGAAALCLEVW